jgi:hypothetical protein
VHNSDRTTLYFCRRCGQAGNAPPDWDAAGTNVCRNRLCLSASVVPIKSTWSFNLLSAELKALNVNMTVHIERNLATADISGSGARKRAGPGQDGGDGTECSFDEADDEDDAEEDEEAAEYAAAQEDWPRKKNEPAAASGASGASRAATQLDVQLRLMEELHQIGGL